MRGAGFSVGALTAFHPSGSASEPRLAERSALRKLFEQPRLQEALVWQNPTAARFGLCSWLATPLQPENAKSRKRERKLLAYLSRYASKNDVIGYFGPIGWGEIAGDSAVTSDLAELEARSVYEEPWVVERLLEGWETEHEFLDRLPLRLSVRLGLEDGWLHGGGGRRRDGRRPMIADEQALLERVHTGPSATWDELLAEGFSDDTILRCVERGWLLRRIAVPSAPHPLNWLYGYLCERGASRRYLESLEELQRLKGDVEGNRGAPAALLNALTSFAEHLEALTGQQASRGAGQTYGGRQPLYEDCRRGGRLKLGETRLEPLRLPLAATLESCRWFCRKASERFAELLDALFFDLGVRYGNDFRLTPLWEALQQTLCEPDPMGLEEVAAELAKRWEAVFAGESELEPELALARASQVFAAETPLYPGARYHSVDLLFPHFKHGPVVLGEIHPGIHPYGTMSAFHQHPDPDDLRRRIEAERTEERVLPALHRPYTRSAHDSWHSPADRHLLVRDGWGSWRDSERTLRLGDLRAVRQGESFLITDGSTNWNPVAFFERDLRIKTALAYAPFPVAGSHRPRRRIGPLIVCREAWRYSREELGFLDLRKAEESSAHAQRWAEEKGLPAQLFVRIASETKPFLWDRKSLLSTELMVHHCRNEAFVKLEEMLPNLNQAWLPNPDGPGLCELRLVAKDGRFDGGTV